MSQKNELKEIAKLFFKLGSISFGGPAAHIAMMEDEVVKKAKDKFNLVRIDHLDEISINKNRIDNITNMADFYILYKQ